MSEILRIEKAEYGTEEVTIDVAKNIERLINQNTLDFVVGSDIVCGFDPIPGHRKTLKLRYRLGESEPVDLERKEREEVVVGPRDKQQRVVGPPSAPALELHDNLIRRFKISEKRLRAPMPIELPNFHRNDLAHLFAELGFTKGAEIGVAEGTYSAILCKAIPNLELLCVDPWHTYDGNPQRHSQAHQDYSLNEAKRRLAGYNAKLDQRYSMDAVRDVPAKSLDFVYIDGNHQFSFVVQDIIEWSRRVKSAGIVSGDDYYELRKPQWDGGVVAAVNAYTQAVGINVWYIFQGHKSVDYMWINP